MVSNEYPQTPGVDFISSFAPIISGVSWVIFLVAMVVWKLKYEIFHVETAFLNGYLEEGNYTICRKVKKEEVIWRLTHRYFDLI